MLRFVTILLALAFGVPALAGEAVYLARVQVDAAPEAFDATASARLGEVLAAWDAPRLMAQSALPAEGLLEAVFVADDQPIPPALADVVRRLAAVDRPLSLYRTRFQLRYGALPLPNGEGCEELDGLQGPELLDAFQRPECKDRFVRTKMLLPALDEQARRAAEAQLEQIRTSLSSAEASDDGVTAQIVVRRVRTYLVTEPGRGERQEAEVEAWLLSATWSQPFETPVVRPTTALTLELVQSVTAEPAAAAPQAGETHEPPPQTGMTHRLR